MLKTHVLSKLRTYSFNKYLLISYFVLAIDVGSLTNWLIFVNPFAFHVYLHYGTPHDQT